MPQRFISFSKQSAQPLCIWCIHPAWFGSILLISLPSWPPFRIQIFNTVHEVSALKRFCSVHLFFQNTSASVSLMRHLEEFGVNLASNIVYIKRKQYRRRRSTSGLRSLNKIEPNLREYCIVCWSFGFYIRIYWKPTKWQLFVVCIVTWVLVRVWWFIALDCYYKRVVLDSTGIAPRYVFLWCMYLLYCIALPFIALWFAVLCCIACTALSTLWCIVSYRTVHHCFVLCGIALSRAFHCCILLCCVVRCFVVLIWVKWYVIILHFGFYSELCWDIFLVMQLEPVSPQHFSGLLFPSEEHKDSLLASPEWQNRTNRVKIPSSLFRNHGAPSKFHHHVSHHGCFASAER